MLRGGEFLFQADFVQEIFNGWVLFDSAFRKLQKIIIKDFKANSDRKKKFKSINLSSRKSNMN